MGYLEFRGHFLRWVRDVEDDRRYRQRRREGRGPTAEDARARRAREHAERLPWEEGRVVCRREGELVTLARRTAFVTGPPLLHLSAQDRDLVRECVRAMANGFTAQVDITALIGVTLADLESLLAAWPDTDAHPMGEGAVHNCLVNAWGYPADEAKWARHFAVSREDIEWVYNKWRLAHGRSPFGSLRVPAAESED